MRNAVMIAAGALALGALLAAGGCSNDPTKGYTLRSQYPQDIRTVSVPIWVRGREVYRRGLEMRLTQAIIQRMELDTPYKHTDKSRADTELRGTIDRVTQRVLSYNPDSGLPREKAITLTVSFTWTDLRSGRVLARQKLSQEGTYIPPSPLGEDFFQGSEDVINKLAKRIVEEMEADW